MNTRRFVLHLIVGLLAFLIGVTAAITLGSFNPFERSRCHSSRHLTIPPQPLVAPTKAHERYYYHHGYARSRTADMRYQNKSLTPPPPPVAPAEPPAPFDEESETQRPPRTPRDTR